MANIGFVFNAAEVNPEFSGNLPVAQKQLMMIFDSAMEATKGNANHGMAVLHVRYMDGPNSGAEGVYRLNLHHSSQQTVEIAKKQLSALAHVLGVQTVTDTAQLHNIPFRADVDYQRGHNPATDGSEAKGYTEIRKVYDQNGNAPKNGQFGAQPAQQQPQQNFQQQQPPAQQQQQPQQGFGGQQQPAQNQPQGAGNGQQWGNNQPVQQGNGQPAWGGGAGAGAGQGAAWK